MIFYHFFTPCTLPLLVLEQAEVPEMNYIIMNSQMLSFLPSLNWINFCTGLLHANWRCDCWLETCPACIRALCLLVANFCVCQDIAYLVRNTKQILWQVLCQHHHHKHHQYQYQYLNVSLYFLIYWISNFYANFKHWII